MSKRSCLAIILAAGEGVRMKSALPKVLHPVGGLPMLGHVLAAVKAAGATRVAVVVGVGAEAVTTFVAKQAPEVAVYVQNERLGTAHAVLAARKEFAGNYDDVVVVYGDTPMVTAATLRRARAPLARGADVVVVGFRPPDPLRYGRLIMDGRRVTAIREFADADAAERKIGFVNGGLTAFSGKAGPGLLKAVDNDNTKGEYYLTSIVEIANRRGKTVTAIEADADEVLGADSRHQLAHVEGLFQRRARQAAMAAGVTLIAPSTVWFSFDTKLGRDVTIEPNVFFAPGVTVADNVTIRANSHLEGARIEAGAIVGPFARLRPGAVVGRRAHVGNFVEVKNATLGEGVKANHLTYIGDASVGARTNVGAGTITCNYDGFDKHRTKIGADVFVGSNTSLVAPVTVGDRANVAAGSVITHDVAADALAVARGRQVDKPGWAKKFRARKRDEKRKPAKTR